MSDEYMFTEDWFSRHSSLWENVLTKLEPSKILEIGSFEGRATTFMIEQCGERNPTNIYCVDSWQGGVDCNFINADFADVQKRFDRNVEIATQRVKHPVKVFKLVGDSFHCLSKLVVERIEGFDLTYVDASHIASDVFFDAAMAFQLTRVGGAIIFDDYRQDDDNPYGFPKIAIDAFVKTHFNKIQAMKFYSDGKPIPEDKLYQRYYWKVAA